VQKLTGAFYYQLFGIVMIVAVMFIVGRYVPVASTLADVQQQIAAAGHAAPVAYPLLIAVCNLLLLPAGILSVGGGFFFGLWWGFAIVLAGNVLAAAVAFFLGRKLGRKRMERLLRHHAKWAHLDEAIEREGWKIIVLSQLHPLFPVSLINYIYGITRIRFWPCLWWTLIGRAPGIFLYVYLGTLGQFGLNLARGKNRPAMEEYLFWIGGLVLIFLLTGALGRLALRLLKEAEEKAAESAAASGAKPPSDPPLKPSQRTGEDERTLLEFEAGTSVPPLTSE
jgi:uncharacterized membrane protein YdjX (TVP38/TMEM64 family)